MLLKVRDTKQADDIRLEMQEALLIELPGRQELRVAEHSKRTGSSMWRQARLRQPQMTEKIIYLRLYGVSEKNKADHSFRSVPRRSAPLSCVPYRYAAYQRPAESRLRSKRAKRTLV